jgi:hypothetical protein
MPSFASIFISPLFLALFLTLAQESRGQLVPDGLLDFVPEACGAALNDIVLPCAITNLCLTLLPTDEDLAGIPDESDIGSCADVEAGLCPITSRCPQCKEEADDFFKCIIVNNEGGSISANVTALITGCSLDCNSAFETSDPTTAPTDAPTDTSPTEAPATDSSAPTDIPGATESTEAPTESGAANMMASTGSIIGGATLFLLAWPSMTP